MKYHIQDNLGTVCYALKLRSTDGVSEVILLGVGSCWIHLWKASNLASLRYKIDQRLPVAKRAVDD